MTFITKKLILFSIILMVYPVLMFANQQPEERLITVTGEAEILVVPDEVMITLGIETWSEQLDSAKEENDQQIQKIISVAKKHKIEEKHIQTDYLSIEPKYVKALEHTKLIDYFVRRTLVLRLNDVSRFDRVLSDVLEAGVDYVHGIKFRTSKLRMHKDHARSLAIKAAQEKANALAKELGQTVGKPYRIEENYSGWRSFYSGNWGLRWAGGMTSNITQNANIPNAAAIQGSLALGQIKVSAKVTVSFELD